jgi:hypothetical protein
LIGRKKTGKAGQVAAAFTIHFTAIVLRPKATAKPAAWSFLKLPDEASQQLPSRGMVSVNGTLNGSPLSVTLEPDGRGGHWMKLDRKLVEGAGVSVGDRVHLEMMPVEEEPEPLIPKDLRDALAAAPRALGVWSEITPVARRDWIHWITSGKRAQTRTLRLEKACDMLANGKRRPCCFDRSGLYSKSMTCPAAEGES